MIAEPHVIQQAFKTIKASELASRMYQCKFRLPNSMIAHIGIEVKFNEKFDAAEFRGWFSKIIEKNVDEFASSDVHYLCDQMFYCIAAEYQNRKVKIILSQTVDTDIIVEYN